MRGYLLYLMLAPAIGQAASTACPTSPSAQNLETFRTEMVSKLNGWNKQEVVADIERCFPAEVPACLERTYKYASTMIAPSGNYKLYEREMEMRTPPKEMFAAPAAPAKGGRKKPSTAVVPAETNQLYSLWQGSGKNRTDIESIAKKNGWPMVRYKSRHAGGFDQMTSSLLMIRVPGEKMRPPVDYDRYLNIALPADPNEERLDTIDVAPVPAVKVPTADELKSGHNMPSVFTMVTVKKSNGRDPSRVIFSKFNRIPETGDFKFDQTLEPTTCYSCHPSGLRSISPLGYHVNNEQHAINQHMPDDYWKAVKEMNDSMARNQGGEPPIMGQSSTSDGKTRIYHDTAFQGPVIGPNHPLSAEVKTENGRTTTTYPTRTRDFIVGADGNGGCAVERREISVRDIFGRSAGRDNKYTWIPGQPVDWGKIKEAMECEACHDGKMRGTLNSKTDYSQIDFKILVDQSMPEGWHRNPLDQSDNRRTPVSDRLNNNERMALTNCLKAEFRIEENKLPLWATVAKCQNPGGGSSNDGSGGNKASEPNRAAE